MNCYQNYILPYFINGICSSSPITKQREKIVPLAKGEVLEIGIGSGLNLPFYDESKVNKIWGLEPYEGMRKLAEKKIKKTKLNVEFIDLPGEEIPLPSSSVDTVLVTYSLCTIPDVFLALEGMRRVLKPNGKLLFSEHGLAPDRNVRIWQERLNPCWSKIAGGCNLNKNIPQIINTAGFQIEGGGEMYIPGMRFISYNYWGSAVIR